MADSTLHALSSQNTPLSTDEFYLVTTPFTSGTDRKITFANFEAGLTLANQIGYGSLATSSSVTTFTNKTISGSTNTITDLAASSISSGTLAVARGGTGVTTSTGTGSVVLSTSPALTTPNIGVATATSVNGLTITASTGTLTITNAKTLAVSNTLTFTGTDSSSIAFGTGGTVVYTTVTALTSLASVGTITSGTWNGTVVGATYGGTGVNNGSSTITLAGNLVTSGANALTLTTTGTTNVTLPTTGTLVNSAVTTLSSLVSIGTIATGVWNGTVIGATYGGTGNAFFAVSGPSASTKTFTFPNATSTVLTDNAAVTVAQGGTGNTTFTAYALIAAGTTATGAFQNVVGVGTSGQLLQSAGAGALPVWATVSAGTPTQITVANEATDATCFPLFVTAATGDLAPKTNAGLTFNSSTGALVATLVNGLTITANGTNTLNIAAGKTLAATQSITLTGTDSTIMTFPTTTATIARTDAGQTFTGVQVMTSPSITTSITTGSTTFSLVNATATTVNFAGAATTLNIGTSATVLNFGGGATAAEFRFLEPSGSGTNYTAIKAVAQSANITYSLPPTVGAAGTFLKDSAGDGVLTWATPSGGIPSVVMVFGLPPVRGFALSYDNTRMILGRNTTGIRVLKNAGSTSNIYNAFWSDNNAPVTLTPTAEYMGYDPTNSKFYVGDRTGTSIYQYADNDTLTGETLVTISGTGITSLSGISVSSGFGWIFDGTDTIRKYTISGSTWTHSANITLGVASGATSSDFEVNAAQTHAYIIDETNGIIRKILLSDGSLADSRQRPMASGFGVFGVAKDAAGNLWTAGQSSTAIGTFLVPINF